MKELLPKAAFVLSVGVLGFAYGFATEAWSLFPRSYMERAWRQARSLYISSSKHFLHDRVYDRSGTRIVDADGMQPGLTLLTSWWKEEGAWVMKARLIDREGTVHYEWKLDGEELFADSRRMEPYIHGTHLFPDGDLMLNVEYGGTVRLDACSDIKWQLPERGHHSIERDDEGNFWIPSLSPERRRGSEQYPDGYPGLGLVWGEPIMNATEDGKVLDKINVLDVLYENNLQRHFVKTGSYRGDVTHMNDVEPLSPSMAGEYPLFEAGDLLVSLRNIDLVFVMDPETREVKWSTSDPFHSQHDPDFVGDGWIGVFDNARDFNGGRMLGGSRIVALRPHTGEREVWFPTEKSDRFYTPAGGKWQQLENGNMLLIEARAGRVVEVDSTGRTVWEWIKDPEGRSQVAEVLGGMRHDLTPKEVEAWPCASSAPTKTSNNAVQKDTL